MRTRRLEEMVPWPQRDVLRFNETLAHGYLSDNRLAPSYSAGDIRPIKPNGDYGLDEDVDVDSWRLGLDTGLQSPALTLTLADVKSLPRVTQIIKFHCIEGWSTVVEWTGARFADFTRRYFPAGAQLPAYVYMETPDSQYYVGLDMKSALHPQTLLCYEMNSQPLEDEHGAPLRLVIPVKYGIKSIKRIGLIRYAEFAAEGLLGGTGVRLVCGSLIGDEQPRKTLCRIIRIRVSELETGFLSEECSRNQVPRVLCLAPERCRGELYLPAACKSFDVREMGELHSGWLRFRAEGSQ